MKRGRKPLTPEQRALASTKYRNIAIEADLVDYINKTADELASIFGFRPTIAQTVRHLLKKAKP